MECTIADRFPGLHPLELRHYRACEVVNIINRLMNQPGKSKQDEIVRPAGDTWF